MVPASRAREVGAGILCLIVAWLILPWLRLQLPVPEVWEPARDFGVSLTAWAVMFCAVDMVMTLIWRRA